MLKLPKLPKQMTQKNILIGGILLLFIIAAFYGYNKYAKPLIERKNVANMEHNLDKSSDNVPDNGTLTVVFFFADWCPHCKKVKEPTGSSIWDKLQQSERVGEGQIINGYNITYEAKDCTDNKSPITQQVLEEYKVEGFPTFKVKKGNEIIEFDAKPELEALERFIMTTVSD